MVTRRTTIGAGLAVASVACAAGVCAYSACAPAPRSRDRRPIDALLIDDSLEMPRSMVALIKASGGGSPVIAFQLDAAAQAGLRRVLNKSQAIVGLSSGAALFCVERIAWDHGFRLTARSERRANDPVDDAFRQDVAAFLSGTAASSSPLARAYRPSRADGMLHAWVMQKSAGNQLLKHHQEA